MTEPLTYVGLVLLSYVLGSVPTGLLIGKLMRGVDIRQYGSGSSGSTNVFRTLGAVPAAIVVAVDLLKGTVPTLLAIFLASEAPLVAALAGSAAIAGHSWPVFAGFRGGRGVITGWGVIIAMSPIAAAVTAVGFVVVAVTRYASVGSLIGTLLGAASLTVLAVMGRLPLEYLVFAAIGAVMIVGRHWPNIVRLVRGSENRLDAPGRPRRLRTRHTPSAGSGHR